MKIPSRSPFATHRPLLALSLGCALAALPLAVRAQDVPVPTSPDTVAPTTTAPMQMPAEKPPADLDKPAAAADAPATDKLSAKEAAMVRKFAQGNAGEVETAKLALANAESQDVKDFAQKMIDDHGQANEDLLALGKAHGLDLKAEPTAAEKAADAKLMKLKGAGFDAMYLKHALADHTADVKEYHLAKKEVKDPHLLAYLEKTTPIIEGHLAMVKEMQAKMMPEKSAKKGKKS